LAESGFWEINQSVKMNDGHRLILNRLLDGFEGKLTTARYAELSKCSQHTAWRDILPLIEDGILVRNPAGGSSTSYSSYSLAAPALKLLN
jgi:Fic family protein